MSITHVAAVRNALADAVVDRLDLGAVDANGDLVLMAAGDVTVATLAMANPAYGAAANGTAGSNAIADDTNAVGGTLALFKVQDRDNAEVFRGTITGIGGGGDVEASSTTVNAGDTVQCTGLDYSASA